jgi:hypothetical protein
MTTTEHETARKWQAAKDAGGARVPTIGAGTDRVRTLAENTERLLRMSADDMRLVNDRLALRVVGRVVATWSVTERPDLAVVARADGSLVYAAESALAVAGRIGLRTASLVVGPPDRLHHERRRRVGYVLVAALRDGVRLEAAPDVIAVCGGVFVELP